MKRVIFFILFFIVICFVIPMIFTIKRNTKEKFVDTNEINSIEETYNYEKYSNIKLLHSETNEVEEILLDEYIVRSCMCRNASKL